MKFEIRNLKVSAFASKETTCFEGAIYLDGKKLGTAHNDGHGGATHIEPRECREQLNAHAATLPKLVSNIKDGSEPGGFFTFQPTGETFVGSLVTESIVERDFKKAPSKRILFTKEGKAGIFQTKTYKAEELKDMLAYPTLAQTLKALKILNLLPLAEALAIYKVNI
jgi:hypothetical protein